MYVLNSFFSLSPIVFVDVSVSAYPGRTTQHGLIAIFIMGESIYYV